MTKEFTIVTYATCFGTGRAAYLFRNAVTVFNTPGIFGCNLLTGQIAHVGVTGLGEPERYDLNCTREQAIEIARSMHHP